MKKIISFLALTLVLVSCGTRNGYFKIDGQFLHLNQGEFYVYSTDGIVDGLDTIKIEGGRFTYETPCPEIGTLVLVFPNFSEQPVFAESGRSVSVKADASHLKELKVTGTDDNELMNAFREQIAQASPPETTKAAEQFIKDHPESQVSIYLLRKYFMQNANGDYSKAITLADLILKKQPQNGHVLNMKKAAKDMQQTQIGHTLPRFSATDIDGRPITSNSLHGKYGIVYTWASWSYESQDMQRRIKAKYKKSPGKLAVIGICLDATKKECRNSLRFDSLKWSIVCDEMMFESPLLDKIGIHSVPNCLVMDPTGRIIARQLSPGEMKTRLDSLIR